MQPFTPEPIERLRIRYCEAIVNLYDLREASSFTDNRPSDKPVHVLDSPDGLRLIVSREQQPSGARGIHVSASLMPDSTLYAAFAGRARSRGPARTYDDFRVAAIQRFREISSMELPESQEKAAFIGFSEGKGVPHWFIRDKEES